MQNGTGPDSDGEVSASNPKASHQTHTQKGDLVEVPPSKEQRQELWEPPVNLSHLEEQQLIVCQMS